MQNNNCANNNHPYGVNKGISCDVNNCYYHDGTCYCTAEQINVGPSNAITSSDTLCATFKPKEN